MIDVVQRAPGIQDLTVDVLHSHVPDDNLIKTILCEPLDIFGDLWNKKNENTRFLALGQFYVSPNEAAWLSSAAAIGDSALCARLPRE